jgi:DNA-directed RNA polymerase specialized sigma24 family protein
VELELEPTTVPAFQLVALDEASAAEAADQLGICLTVVYIPRSPVLGRLRELAEGLLDD